MNLISFVTVALLIEPFSGHIPLDCLKRVMTFPKQLKPDGASAVLTFDSISKHHISS
jgi:hypothetical protein